VVATAWKQELMNLTPYPFITDLRRQGSATGQAVWSIRRESKTKENDIVIVEWADGNELFDNVWEQRIDLAYSSGSSTIT
jgi:hypothetical protein